VPRRLPGADGYRPPKARDHSGRDASGIDELVWYSQDSIHPQYRGAWVRSLGVCSSRGSAAMWLMEYRRLRAAERHAMWEQSPRLGSRLSRQLAALRLMRWSYRPRRRPEIR